MKRLLVLRGERLTPFACDQNFAKSFNHYKKMIHANEPVLRRFFSLIFLFFIFIYNETFRTNNETCRADGCSTDYCRDSSRSGNENCPDDRPVNSFRIIIDDLIISVISVEFQLIFIVFCYRYCNINVTCA